MFAKNDWSNLQRWTVIKEIVGTEAWVRKSKLWQIVVVNHYILSYKAICQKQGNFCSSIASVEKSYWDQIIHKDAKWKQVKKNVRSYLSSSFGKADPFSTNSYTGPFGTARITRLWKKWGYVTDKLKSLGANQMVPSWSKIKVSLSVILHCWKTGTYK